MLLFNSSTEAKVSDRGQRYQLSLTDLAETLEKFNFPGYHKSRKLPITNRLQLERRCIDLTPLSISHPLQPWKSSRKTYEQCIKDKPLSHTEKEVYQFNQHYREAVAVKEKNPSLSHIKKRASRSNALLRPAIAPELFTDMSGERKPLPPELHRKEMIPCQNAAERTEIVPPVPTPRPKISKSEITVVAVASYSAPSAGAQAIPDFSLSPFATIRTDLDLVSSTTEPEVILRPKTVSLRSSMLLKSVFKDFRNFSEGSDADDERDATDLETEAEREDLGKSLSAQDDDDTTSQNQDDGGLHIDFKEMTISKKRHLVNDNGDEGYQSDDYGGTAKNNSEDGTAAQFENQDVKVRSLPSGFLLHSACEVTTDRSMYTDGNFSHYKELNIRKQLSAQRLAKRIKS